MNSWIKDFWDGFIWIPSTVLSDIMNHDPAHLGIVVFIVVLVGIVIYLITNIINYIGGK